MMLRKYLIALFLNCLAVASYAAEFLPLKGANGQIVEFEVKSVQAEGILAQAKGSYQDTLLKWEQLDLEWLAEHQVELWQQKQHIEATLRAAYRDYAFGQSRNQVIQTIRAKNGLQLSNEALNEVDPRAFWVTFDPEALRQLFRFSFNAQGELVEVQMHHNFPTSEPIEDSMYSEWEQLVDMVLSFECPLIEKEAFPSVATWRRLKKKMEPGHDVEWRTHLWEDERRQIELSLMAKEFSPEMETRTSSKFTFFGADMNIASTAKRNTNWLVYTARHK